MKFFDVSLVIIICVVVAAAVVGIAPKYIFKAKDDNIIEEMAEGVIKDETGVDVDLSPSSPEINKNKGFAKK